MVAPRPFISLTPLLPAAIVALAYEPEPPRLPMAPAGLRLRVVRRPRARPPAWHRPTPRAGPLPPVLPGSSRDRRGRRQVSCAGPGQGQGPVQLCDLLLYRDARRPAAADHIRPPA